MKKIVYNKIKKRWFNIFYKKKIKAFSLIESILSILILALILNITFIKYKNFKELKAINEAKTKITNTFYLSANTTLKFQKLEYIILDTVNKKLLVLDDYFRRKKQVNLPKNLIYSHTSSETDNQLNIKFTKNGNISKSFSIYIFDSRENARYKIAFYGFDRSKFLKINTYRKFSDSKIKLEDIPKYNKTTNEDRESFYRDWRKEWH